MRHLILVLALATSALAQQPKAQELAAREFGPSFTVDAAFAPLFGDLDGDGQEDAVLVATSKSPLGDEAEFHYRAIDPYDSYFGWGDPKTTVQFSQTNAGPARYVLIIHDWRAPKQKFVIVNLPFERLSLGRISRKKKSYNSIHAEESGGLSAEVFWDGRKYKWEASYAGD
jgi:hypothetical protein